MAKKDSNLSTDRELEKEVNKEGDRTLTNFLSGLKTLTEIVNSLD